MVCHRIDSLKSSKPFPNDSSNSSTADCAWSRVQPKVTGNASQLGAGNFVRRLRSRASENGIGPVHGCFSPDSAPTGMTNTVTGGQNRSTRCESHSSVSPPAVRTTIVPTKNSIAGKGFTRVCGRIGAVHRTGTRITFRFNPTSPAAHSPRCPSSAAQPPFIHPLRCQQPPGHRDHLLIWLHRRHQLGKPSLKAVRRNILNFRQPEEAASIGADDLEDARAMNPDRLPRQKHHLDPV